MAKHSEFLIFFFWFLAVCLLCTQQVVYRDAILYRQTLTLNQGLLVINMAVNVSCSNLILFSKFASIYQTLYIVTV